MTVNIALFDDLDAVAADADGALDRARSREDYERQQSLFARLSWYRLLQKHCPPPGRLLVVRAEIEEEGYGPTRAWLFLAVRDGAAYSYANYYSLRAEYSHFRAAQGVTEDCIEAIASALRNRGLWKVEIGPGGSVGGYEFDGAGWVTVTEPDKANWSAYVGDGDFAAFWQTRPARLRNTFKRKAKSAALDIEIHDCFDESGWADYESVYRASWKPDEGSFPFLRALAEQEGAAGALRLGIAKKDGQPIAAQLWLVENGTATIHKLAYVEEAKPLSPGTILSEAMFRQAIDRDDVERIDYGLGDEGYKADWMTRRDLTKRLVAYNPHTVRGLAGAAKAKASALVRRARSG